jgi:cytochrome c-type biogenesis protein CcmH
MSERLGNLLAIAAIAVMGAVLVVLVTTNPSDVDRAQSIGRRIMCPVCQGESIANSPAAMARDMMDLVAEKVANGESDEAIVDDLLDSFSGAVLLDPPASGATLVLWLAPAAVLVIGIGVIVWWRRHPSVEGARPEPGRTTRQRRLVPLLILGAAFAGVVVAAGSFLQEREGPASGVAALGEEDLSEVSNETMEAVIAANVGHPEVDGMRLAVAERYYEEGDYRSAFPHYLSVAESGTATDSQAVAALIRLGWMAWEGNAEVDAAVGLLDQALAIDGDSTTARYLKAQVLWCGADQTEEAVALLEEVLSDPDLAADSRPFVQADLETMMSGGSCQ